MLAAKSTKILRSSFDEAEISRELEELVLASEPLELKLSSIAILESAFPKTCRSCGYKIKTRNDLTSLAIRPSKKNVNVIQFTHLGIVEYRHCKCESTLACCYRGQRDESIAGVTRRALFERCLSKLGPLENKAKDQLRKCFRSILNNYSRIRES